MAEHRSKAFDLDEAHRSDERLRIRRVTYAIANVLLAAIIVMAVVDATTDIDLLGVATDTVTAEAEGYELEVRYPSVTRAALATPFDIVVRSEDGFTGPIDIAVDPDWFEMWDYQALYPEASSMTGSPDRVVLTFEPPEGDVLRVFFDARIQPAQQSGDDAWLSVLDETGDDLVRTEWTTRILP